MQNIRFLFLTILIFTSVNACSNSSFDKQRAGMVKKQIELRGITNKSITNAFLAIPREEFVLQKYKNNAYDDLETPIGFGQNLDRPYEDALMIEFMAITPNDRVLEVGTGSGYLAAVISRIAQEVYTIEIDPQIAQMAKNHLDNLGYKNIWIKADDGFKGWSEYAPFNAIVLTCSPDKVPEPLIEQLAEGGRIVLPLGGTKKFQELVLYKKINGKLVEAQRIAPATFVPMKGKVLEK